MILGYRYVAPDGTDMIEYHVDDCEAFLNLRSPLKHRGNLSVRFPEGEPILDHWGQDESVYKLYAERGGAWEACGVIGLRKKHEGIYNPFSRVELCALTAYI